MPDLHMMYGMFFICLFIGNSHIAEAALPTPNSTNTPASTFQVQRLQACTPNPVTYAIFSHISLDQASPCQSLLVTGPGRQAPTLEGEQTF